jgi:hypothetical protein
MTLPLPFPVADHQRIDRVAQDISDLIFHVGVLNRENPQHAEFFRKAERWADQTLRVSAMGHRWWFLDNLKSATIQAGQDIIDLKGHLDRVVSIYAPRRLHLTTLSNLIDLRARAAACNRPNAARECTHYAVEAGKRVHLWPAPSQPISFHVLYQRPMHIALVPHEWEPIIVNGVIGMYGRHFDREQLSQDAAAFEARYREQLREAKTETHDVPVIRRWRDELDGDVQAAANSSTDTAVEVLVPASIEGVGFEMILSTGDYLLVDDGTAPFGQQNYFEVLP